jgi:Rrf2 family protein
MRVTKWGECGILCALYLAQRYEDVTVSASDIADSQSLDLQYTQQILQRLRKGNVIESVRGPKGGYRLTRPPEQTTLKDILYAAEGDTFQIICDYAPIHPNETVPNQCSTRETCSLHGVWQDLRTAIDALLEQRTLADLLVRPTEVNSLIQLGKRDAEHSPSKA